MPLDKQSEFTIDTLQGLDDTIFGVSNNLQFLPQLIDRLMVV